MKPETATNASRPLRIVMVAGEASGDQLGASLIRALREAGPVEVQGIGGSGMQSAGLVPWADQERLAVMGLFEVLRHLPDLLRLRRNLVRRTRQWQPDLFVGIDSPDFNLPLARRLRRTGLKTAHYVSPSVWAWRQGRVRGIRRSVDLMITLFPFESDFYRRHGVPEVCVGHPMAGHLPRVTDAEASRRLLGLGGSGNSPEPLLGVLPGSRRGEVKQLGPGFLETARLLKQQVPALRVVIPAAGPARHEQLAALLGPDDPDWIHLVRGRSHEVMAASDALLVASGTATLEAALLRKPMVVAYRFHALTYWIGSRLVRTPWVALPNILMQKAIVPEMIQNDFVPARAAETLLPLLSASPERSEMVHGLTALYELLHRDSDRLAARALRGLAGHA